MAKDLTVERVEDTFLWDNFVSSSPQGTVFSTSEWLTAGATAQGGKPVILGVREDDTLVAGVSFVEIVRGPLKKASTPVFTPYGGVIYRGDPDKPELDSESLQLQCAEKMIDWLQRKYHHIVLVHAPGFTDIRPFSWQGWNGKVCYTYIIDITDPEKLFKKFRKGTRSKIRQAEKSLILGGITDAEHLADMHERMFRDRNSIPPVSRGIVTSMVSNLMKSGLVDINTAQENNGEVIAVQAIVRDIHTIYSWIYITTHDKRHTGADSLLLWDAVKRYSGSHERLDLAGANIPSVAFFKKAFGGVLTPYYITERYSSLVSRTAFRAYSSVKRFMRW